MLGYEGERLASALQTIKLDARSSAPSTPVPRLRPAVPTHVGPGPGAVGASWRSPSAAANRDAAHRRLPASGDMYFGARTGHHQRARSPSRRRQTTIDAYVTEVTHHAASASDIRTRRDILVCKSYERMFVSPRPFAAFGADAGQHRGAQRPVVVRRARRVRRRRWGFRLQPARGAPRRRPRRDRRAAGSTDEYTPVVRMLRDADLPGAGTEAEAYLRVVAADRYRPTLTHDWSDDVIQRLQRAQLGPAAEAVTSLPHRAVSAPDSPSKTAGIGRVSTHSRRRVPLLDLRRRVEPGDDLIAAAADVGPTGVAGQLFQLGALAGAAPSSEK